MALTSPSRAVKNKKLAAASAAAKKPKMIKAVRAAKTAAASPAPHQSKTAACLDLLRRADGASLQELMAATGWQAHSVRGFVSGTVRKKMGLDLSVVGGNDGTPRYRIIGTRV